MTARKRFTSLLAASALALALAGCGDDPEPVADDTGSDESSEGTPSDEPTEPTSPPASSEPAAETATVPVYFVGDTPQGPRLFREFRKVEADNPLAEAAALMTAGDALDGDYGTAYPEGSFASVEYADGTLVATLSDNAWTKKIQGMTAKQVQLAVQQLVYTLQGVQQERAPVVVQLDGQPTTLFGVDTADGLEAAKELNVLALVNVTTPEESQAVTGTFTAEGVASSFEATVPWQIRQGDQVVKEGFSTALGWVDKLYPWQTDVDVSDLEPGEYAFVALTDDPSGGEGGGPTEDTKTIIVK
jgi:immunoglobulin-like protein involved in spore germination/sporulation and spore germination protein